MADLTVALPRGMVRLSAVAVAQSGAVAMAQDQVHWAMTPVKLVAVSGRVQSQWVRQGIDLAGLAMWGTDWVPAQAERTAAVTAAVTSLGMESLEGMRRLAGSADLTTR
jgi:hypothetical protein